jgi:hypothetical protein
MLAILPFVAGLLQLGDATAVTPWFGAAIVLLLASIATLLAGRR